jgi:hypothetical protein
LSSKGPQHGDPPDFPGSVATVNQTCGPDGRLFTARDIVDGVSIALVHLFHKRNVLLSHEDLQTHRKATHNVVERPSPGDPDGTLTPE